jgi:transposase
MANHLKMAMIQAILTLHGRGWSRRKIARELGIDRSAVSRHLSLAVRQPPTDVAAGCLVEVCDPKPATFGSNPPPGAEAVFAKVCSESEPSSLASNPATSPPLGVEAALNSATPPPPGENGGGVAAAVGAGPVSTCEPFRAIIQRKVDEGLSGRRIYQDLSGEAASPSYDAIKRFLRHLRKASELPFRRMESPPGQECQVDFGTGAMVIGGGWRRRTHVFRLVLSCSRKGYSESVFRQTTEEFLGCLENAFWSFGGVPRTVIVDNLRAAVAHPDWFDPEINPRVEAFCRHYGTVILPTKPRMPRHKGKVEREIGYVQGNGLKGRTFTSLAAQNQHLREWEHGVADTRIHGTTRQHVGKVFEQIERPALLPLPQERFPFFHEELRTVHRDGHVAVARAYYSVPPEYVGRRVWVRWDAHMVKIFNHRHEQVAVHVRHEPGRFATSPLHIPAEKTSKVEKGTTWLLGQTSLLGEQVDRWSREMLKARGIAGVRVLVGLLALAKRHPAEHLDRVCQIASSHQAYRLRALRELLVTQPASIGEQAAFEFTESHPIIRNLGEYDALVQNASGEEQWGEGERNEEAFRESELALTGREP